MGRYHFVYFAVFNIFLNIVVYSGNALKHESDTPCLKFINEPVGVKGNCIIDQIHHTYCSNGETKILDQTNSNPLTLSINTRPTLNNAMVLGSIYEYTQMVVQYSFVKCVAPQTRQGVGKRCKEYLFWYNNSEVMN